MTLPRHAQIFEAARPRLLGLAYRMLGSAVDAEDAVQDTYLRWRRADRNAIKVPDAWLTTACTNRCLDILKSGARKRMEYVGPWLPEPLLTDPDPGPEHIHEMASSLATAFLLLLQRLTARERAAYLLREIFGQSYSQVSETLDLTEQACRQLVARAKRHIGRDQVRMPPPKERQIELLRAFQTAIVSGNTECLDHLLSADIELHADGGGKVIAARRIIHGSKRVKTFIHGALTRNWKAFTLQSCNLNGSEGLLVFDGGCIIAAVSFSYGDDGLARNIYIMRNPDKLKALTASAMCRNRPIVKERHVSLPTHFQRPCA